MKVSVSLPDEDVEFLDAYARAKGYGSRSAALQKAVSMLRTAQLGSSYEDAWTEWGSTGEAEVWDTAVADGLGV